MTLIRGRLWSTVFNLKAFSRNSETREVYEAEYDLSLPDRSVTELRLSPAMIPDTVPKGYDFEEVQKVSFSFVSTVSEDEELVLRNIYPNAEIAFE